MSDTAPVKIQHQALLLVARMLMATIFLHEGVAKLGNYPGAAAYARSFGVPDTLLPLAIALEVCGGLAIALGVGARTASLLLAGFCIVTALAFHAHWAERNQLLHFEKNLAMAGGLLLLGLCGPGRLTVLLWRRNATQ